jgi:hypothetical protein
VAIRAEQHALAGFLTHAFERTRIAVADRERLLAGIDVMELQRGRMFIEATDRAAPASLDDQQISHACPAAHD